MRKGVKRRRAEGGVVSDEEGSAQRADPGAKAPKSSRQAG